MKITPYKAIALIVNDRFFVGWGKAGRLKTAWSLAGATLYQDNFYYYKKDKQRIEKKGYRVSVWEVSA